MPGLPCRPRPRHHHHHRRRRLACRPGDCCPSSILTSSVLFPLFLLATATTAETSRTTNHLYDSINTIRKTVLDWQHESGHAGPYNTTTSRTKRPFITLAFAQSLDGKIARKVVSEQDTDARQSLSSNLPLSSPDSLVMTHALRSVHDAILVGGNTLRTDNPRLSNRLWKTNTGTLSTNDNLQQDGSSVHDNEAYDYAQPRPVVLDTNLGAIRELGDGLRANNTELLVCCSHAAATLWERQQQQQEQSLLLSDNTTTMTVGKNSTLVPCETMTIDGDNDNDSTTATTRLDLDSVLHELWKRGIRSVMVEGGAGVLSAFVRHRLFDCVCVTVAPKWIGNDHGVASIHSIRPNVKTTGSDAAMLDLAFPLSASDDDSPSLQYYRIGNDIVLLSYRRNEK